MAYSIELEGRTIFLAAKAETPMGDYIVYEWNDGIFIPEDDEDWEYEDIDPKEFIKQLKRLRINLLNLKKRLEDEYL